MSKAFANTDNKRRSAFTVLLSVFWICGFLVVFFRQSITSTELSRSDVILVLIDTLLGFGDGAASPGGADLHTGLQYLPQRFPHIAVAVLLLFFAGVYGDAFFQCFRIRSIGTRLETLIIKLGAGLSLLSLTTLICGLAGEMDRATLPCCTLAAGFLSAFMRLRSRRPMADLMQLDQPEMLSRSADVPTRWLRMAVLFIVVPFGAYLLLGALSPQRDFDVREYHLQGPKEWFQQGQITFLRHNVYTSFPFLSEMLLLAGMMLMGDWWSGALSGQLVLGCYQLLTAGCVFSIARRRIGIDAGWLALLIYMPTPWILRISIIAYAEGALSFYLTVAAMLALRSREHDPKHSAAFGMICGLLAGSAMASKYTGLVSVIAPTLFLLIFPGRRPAGAVEGLPGAVSAGGTVNSSQILPRTLVFFVAGILLAMLPWLLRNLSDTGNPVYPLGWSVFGGTEWSDEMNARWKPAHAPREGHPPVEIITRHFPDVAVRDTWTSGLLFALSVPAVLLWQKIPAIRVLLGLLLWGFAAWWAFTHRIDRFWIPLIPLLSVVASSTWYLSGRYSWRLFLSSVILLVTVYNVYFCMQGLVGDHAGLTELGRAKELRIRPDFRYLNETLPTNARVLMVGEAEVFDAQFSVVYNTVFDDCIFEQMTMNPDESGQPARSRRMRSADEIRRIFADAGITHVLVNWSEILRYRAPYSYGYSDYVQPVRFQQLVRMTVLQPPKVLLSDSWADLTDSERNVVQQWDGYEQLVSESGSWTTVLLFVVEHN